MTYVLRSAAVVAVFLAAGTGLPGADLAWIDHGQPTRQARALIEAFSKAAMKGLSPGDYGASSWPRRLAELRAQPSEATFARFDAALTSAAIRYVSDLHQGRANPGLFHAGFDLDRGKYDDIAGFVRTRLANSADLAKDLEAIEPPFPGYRRAQAALQKYLKLSAQGDLPTLSTARIPVKPGDEYPGSASLGRLLKRLGDLPPEATVEDGWYKGNLVDAVKHFQSRHGLDPDGQIGRETFRHLNAPISKRVQQLRWTLERYRWAPHRFAVQPIVVNIPEFRLRAFNSSYTSELEMKVVAGRAYGHQTPVLAGELTSVVFRPYWNVPLSIQRAEIVPHIVRDRSYLARNGYEVVPSSKQSVVDDGTLDRLRSGRLRIRQAPGDGNALGLVKFVFPNPYDVYMHGTPATQLFSKSRRDFSHGCIRLEKPEALAALVLREKPEWSPGRIAEAMHGTRTITVQLDRPIPVLIVYATAVVQENGEVDFYDDIYGLDAALEKAVAAAGRCPMPLP